MQISRVLLPFAATLALAACAVAPPAVQPPPAPPPAPKLVPQPAHLQRLSGAFTVDASTPVRVATDDPAALSIAGRFVDLVQRTRGIDLPVPESGDDTTGSAIVFALDAPDLGPEAYRLRVGTQGIRVSAAKPAGLFYGAATLWQLLTPDAARPAFARVPALRIEDRPRFAWRGLMLDSARHFQRVDQIKRLIDWMALHKLNTLHWHLTDDQGWRLQIRHYPRLTTLGSCRRAIGPDAALTGGEDKPYCGYYTQAQVRELVAYAAQRYVTIVPELDMPGHAQAAIAAYPEFGVTGRRPPVSTDWGVHTWLYNVDDASVKFLENVLDEVMELFPSTYIHVGGDEAAKDQWKASKAVRRRMRQLGVKDADALQGWLMAKMEHHLAAHGRRLIGWDEILEGGLPAQATVMSWRGIDGAIAAANAGHDVVLSPSPTLYLDHLQSDGPDEPAGRPQVESLHDIYDFDPVPAKIAADKARHVLGVQANLWTEYMPTFARDQRAIFPRLAALAERAWSPAAAIGWSGFLDRLPAQLARYRALGIDYADSAYAPRIDSTPGADGRVAVTLSDQVGRGRIRYTIDGSAPTVASPAYAAPLTLSMPVTVRAATFGDDGAPLSAPRRFVLDPAALRTRASDRLKSCADKLVLRIEDDRPLQGQRPFYNLDIMDMCWMWPAAPLDGATGIAVRVGNLPWNYQLWNADKAVVKRRRRGPAGELEVHLDGCDGPLLARWPLAEAASRRGQTVLRATMPSTPGRHDLCLFATGDPHRGLWAIDTVSLSPPATPSP